MKQSLAEKLITQYFTQFTEGCDSIECQEPECRSCPSFSHDFKNANEAAYAAIKAALTHPFDDHICPGINQIKINPILRNDLVYLDTNIKNYINSYRQNPENQAIQLGNLQILTRSELFPYILLSNEDKLSPQNLAISDDLFSDFIRMIKHVYQKIRVIQKSFEIMVNEIITGNSNTYHHIRALIILFCFEPFYTVGQGDSKYKLLNSIIHHIVNLPPKHRNLFFEALQKLPRISFQILDICQNVITLYIYQSLECFPGSQFFCDMALFLMNLREISSFRSMNPLASSKFSNDEFSRLIDVKKFYERRHNVFRVIFYNPAILSLMFKNEVFHFEQNIKQKENAMAAVQTMPRMLFDRNELIRNIHLQLRVHRDNLINDTIQEISRMRKEHLNRPLMVTFYGEEALDAGGVSREYFQLLTERLFSPDYGMFTLVKNKYYWFNILSTEIDVSPVLFKTLGTVVALAVYNGIILPIRFPLVLYKKILGKSITLIDFQLFDPELFKSLNFLIDMKKKGQDVSSLYLNFTTTIDKFGTPVDVPLVQNGENIDVTNDNVDEYIQALIDWKMNVSIKTQYEAFNAGFVKLFNGEIFNLFAPDELDILVSGEEVFDWEELKKNAKYKDGYSHKSKVVKWFWEIFDAFPADMKSKFLLFTTGSDRAPVGGLANVIITIQKVNDPTKLPVSHTCFNVFCLPNYSKKNDLKRMLEIALTQTEGFGLV